MTRQAQAEILVKQYTGQNIEKYMIDTWSARTGARQFLTLPEWGRKGYRVKRGEKSFPVVRRVKGNDVTVHTFHEGQVYKGKNMVNSTQHQKA